MHIVVLIILVFLSLIMACVCSNAYFEMAILFLMIFFITLVTVIAFSNYAKEQVVESNQLPTETYTLVDQSVKEGEKCYVLIDGSTAHYAYHVVGHGTQVGDADMSDVTIHYSEQKNTLTVDCTVITSRKVWGILKDSKTELVKYHYSFYVPKDGVVYTYVE